MARKSTEKETQRAVLDYLTAKNIFHWRNNTGAVVATYKGKERFMRYGAVGSPDVFALRNGTLYGLEIKDERGVVSDNQKEFGRKMTDAGGVYVVIRNVDEVIALF
jgi:hypothetical protein